MLVKAKDLRKLYKEKGRAWTCHHVRESIEKKELSPHDFSLRDMAAELIPDGHEFLAMMSRSRGSGSEAILEDASSVDTSAFTNITGQLLFSAINQAMELDELIGDQLCVTMPSTFQDDERIPGISTGRDEFAEEVPEGENYPLVGLSEEYVTIPRAEKRGGIIGITREMVIADRTGFLLERAGAIGKGLAIRREKSIIDVFIGGVNPYVRKGIARNTYANVAGTSYFDNIITDALVNYTDVQAAAALYYQMRDPNTGEPLAQSPSIFVCCPELTWTAKAVFHDTSVELGLTDTAPGIRSRGSNRIPWTLKMLANEWITLRLLANNGNGGLTVANRAQAITHWFLGRPDAFVWKEIWPLSVEQAPANNEAQFTSDVWARYKVSYKGVAGVREPRYMIRSDGTA
jgi:hypothetical protein